MNFLWRPAAEGPAARGARPGDPEDPLVDTVTRAVARSARRRRLQALAAWAIALPVLAVCVSIGEISLSRLAEGLPRIFSYVGRTMPDLSLATLPADVAHWYWRWEHWLEAMWETIVISLLATICAFAASIVLCFMAARTIAPPWLSATVRRVLEFLRTVPEVVFALFFVFAFGIGPFAGFLALFVGTTGSLAKLFTEVVENAPTRNMEALTATGATLPVRLRYGIVPIVAPDLASYTLLSFEGNVRTATVVGFVGGGGIGQDLMFAIKQFQYTDISAIVLLIMIAVTLTDIASGRLRGWLTSGGSDRRQAPVAHLSEDAVLVHFSHITAPHWKTRLLRALPWVGGALVILYCLWAVEATPEKIVFGLFRLFGLLGVMLPPEADGMLPEYLYSLAETIAMAVVGTVLAVAAAIVLGVLAARTLMPFAPVRFVLRRVMDAVRGIDTLVWALIFVGVVGLGPFAGILAMAIKDAAVLGKLYSEAIENVDRRPVEALKAAGNGPLRTFRFAFIPQLSPILVGQALYFFEGNVRSATILGIVGAGGIGFHLADRIGVNDWQNVTTILILLLVTVALTDRLSATLRMALINARKGAQTIVLASAPRASP